MARNLHLVYGIIVLALGLVACGNENVVPSEQQVRDLAWQALEPNTSSHNRDAWEIIEIKKVVGREIASQFEDAKNPDWCPGPAIVTNDIIDPIGIYWYVHLEPRFATSLPPQRTMSPTEPALIPEPWISKAIFLIDATYGRMVARILNCVVY
jgi:hypothetical protein